MPKSVINPRLKLVAVMQNL